MLGSSSLPGLVTAHHMSSSDTASSMTTLWLEKGQHPSTCGIFSLAPASAWVQNDMGKMSPVTPRGSTSVAADLVILGLPKPGGG